MAIRLLIISSFIITKLIGDGWELHGEFQLRVKLISCDGIDYFWLFIIGINRSSGRWMGFCEVVRLVCPTPSFLPRSRDCDAPYFSEGSNADKSSTVTFASESLTDASHDDPKEKPKKLNRRITEMLKSSRQDRNSIDRIVTVQFRPGTSSFI